jgi:phage gpG-like protein
MFQSSSKKVLVHEGDRAKISTLHDMNMKAICGTNAEYAKLVSNFVMI